MRWYNTADIFSPYQEEFEWDRKDQPLICAAFVNVLG